MPAYWLVKSEPSVCSIDTMARERVTMWEGVRNYQARNFLREMSKGDSVLFYHSSADPVGVAGIVEVARESYPDPTQFDKRSAYYEPAATRQNPRWICPDLKFVKKFRRVIQLSELKERKELKGMSLLQKGSRLSVHSITKAEFDCIVSLADGGRK